MSGDPGRPEPAPLGDLGILGEGPWAPWPVPHVLETTPSTMLDVERLAAEGAPEGTVVVAEEQTAGRGRRGRSWESAPRAGLWLSLLLRPTVPPEQLGWLPLVVGVGVARAVREHTGVEALLKWPNDVVVDADDPVKVAGILAERLGDGAVVVGVGMNVDQVHGQLPEGGASLRMLGAEVDRTSLLVQVLSHISGAYREWQAGTDMAPEYASLSATLGRDVTVDLGERRLRGRATSLGSAGELVVTDSGGTQTPVSAGDVALVRPAR